MNHNVSSKTSVSPTDSGNMAQFISVTLFFHSLGIGRTKFYRLLKQRGLPSPGGLMSPKLQNYYCVQLGFPSRFSDLQDKLPLTTNNADKMEQNGIITNKKELED